MRLIQYFTGYVNNLTNENGGIIMVKKLLKKSNSTKQITEAGVKNISDSHYTILI